METTSTRHDPHIKTRQCKNLWDLRPTGARHHRCQKVPRPSPSCSRAPSAHCQPMQAVENGFPKAQDLSDPLQNRFIVAGWRVTFLSAPRSTCLITAFSKKATNMSVSISKAWRVHIPLIRGGQISLCVTATSRELPPRQSLPSCRLMVVVHRVHPHPIPCKACSATDIWL